MYPFILIKDGISLNRAEQEQINLNKLFLNPFLKKE